MTAYVSAAVLCVAATAVGLAVCGRDGAWTWLAPPVGLAGLTLLALFAVHLPGHGTTAAVAVTGATVVAVVVLRRRRVDLRPSLEGLAVAAFAIAICSLPFIANDRMGVLGASVLDDLSFHMAQADALGRGAGRVTAPGYPNGPHALVAALDAGLRAGPPAGFTALLLAVPALTALTALAALERSAWYVRIPAAVLTGVPYLAVSYLAQGAFKEPMVALFFLGFVLTLRAWRRDGVADGRRALSLGLVAAAGVAVFGIVALAWPAAALLWLGLLEPGTVRAFARRHRPRVGALGPVALMAVPAGVLAAALAVGAWAFFDRGPGHFLGDHGPGGNFIGQLSPLEALGVWRQLDFRTAIANPLRQPELLLAVAVVGFGAVWCWRRRERVLLAGALAGMSVYVVARPVTLAYFSGKALTIAAVPLMLMTVKALVAVAGPAPFTRPRWPALGATVALGAFGVAAAASSALALRAAHVRPSPRGPDLAAFRPLVKGELTVYLARDNFALWELRGATLRGFQGYNPASRLAESPLKVQADAHPPAVDSDSVNPLVLAVARFLITPRTPYASRPPSNFRPIRRTRWHVLWERRGPTLPRRILAEGEAPGKTLDCRTPEGRRLAATAGVADVRPAPVEGRARAWRAPDGSAGGVYAESGEARQQTLRLGPGTFDLSLRYFSDVPLRLRASTLRTTLPAYVADSSTFASAGRIAWRGGPLGVRVDIPPRRRVGTTRSVGLGTVVATRVDEPGRLVPLGQACGRYVDWYRPSAR